MVMLSGFRPVDIIRKLRRAGFVFDRQARGSHEIWIHPITHRRAIVPFHRRDMSPGTVRSIIRQAGLTVQEFLEL